MTQPGSVVPPRPGWWVRTGRVGVVTASYGWALTRKSYGHAASSYAWAGAAYSTGGDQFPYVFPFTVGADTITATLRNTQGSTVNAIGDGSTTIPKAVQTSSASTLTLTSAKNVYVYTGSTASTWTLPAVSGPTLVLWCFNRGSGTVTIQRASTNQIYANKTLVNSIAMPPGTGLQLNNDSIYWIKTT